MIALALSLLALHGAHHHHRHHHHHWHGIGSAYAVTRAAPRPSPTVAPRPSAPLTFDSTGPSEVTEAELRQIEAEAPPSDPDVPAQVEQTPAEEAAPEVCEPYPCEYTTE